ncbi:hypothetical protein [Brevundimonas sp.]|uniref:hypothetical protein n=1 Tax=Brevundimonas sp. TaxID=1871086 RepID=UPI0035B00A5B
MWLALAGLTGGWSLTAVGAGDGALLPALLSVVALGCALDDRLGDRVMAGALRAFSGSGLRLVAIVVGAAFLWQLVGLELALLMAGDVLAYVEVLAAVSLIAARTRLGPVRAALGAWMRQAPPRLRAWLAVLARSARAARPVRRRPSPAVDDDAATGIWACA